MAVIVIQKFLEVCRKNFSTIFTPWVAKKNKILIWWDAFVNSHSSKSNKMWKLKIENVLGSIVYRIMKWTKVFSKEVWNLVKEHWLSISHKKSHYNGKKAERKFFVNSDLTVKKLHTLFLEFYKQKTGEDCKLKYKAYHKVFRSNSKYSIRQWKNWCVRLLYLLYCEALRWSTKFMCQNVPHS